MAKIAFLGGSKNQTRIALEIALELQKKGHQVSFSPMYSENPFLNFLRKFGLLEKTILGTKRRQEAEQILKEYNSNLDKHIELDDGLKGNYDLVVLTQDLLIPENLPKKRVLVQEGMFTPDNFLSYLSRKFYFLPLFLGNTSNTGLSVLRDPNSYDYFFVMNDYFRRRAINLGIPSEKVFATGIPLFDKIEVYEKPQEENYILCALSPFIEDQLGYFRTLFFAVDLAKKENKRLLVKLHPTESQLVEKVLSNFVSILPRTANAKQYIQNSYGVVAQYSSVLIEAQLYEKPAYSLYLNPENLKPIINNGQSALTISNFIDSLLS
ncbi:MAG: hypothetical protein QXR96_03680 [Candidatus Woesearchaeota archaeon]